MQCAEIIIENSFLMSKDLQEKSDKMIKELKDYLIPISEEIRKLKRNDIKSE